MIKLSLKSIIFLLLCGEGLSSVLGEEYIWNSVEQRVKALSKQLALTNHAKDGQNSSMESFEKTYSRKYADQHNPFSYKMYENWEKFSTDRKPTKAEVLENFKSVRVVLHQDLLNIYKKFYEKLTKVRVTNDILKNKLEFSDVTTPSLTSEEKLVTEIINKRAYLFWLEDDESIHIDTSGDIIIPHYSNDEYKNVGKESQEEPTTDRLCLDYDHLKLSGHLLYTANTYFFNSCGRGNQCRYVRDGHELQGLVMGLIGPRFEKDGVMDVNDMIFVEGFDRRNEPSDLDKEIRKYYQLKGKKLSLEEDLHLYAVLNSHNGELNYYEKKPQAKAYNATFKTNIYKGRISLMFETALLEANSRVPAGMKGFFHMTGAGLGVWRKHAEQNHIYVKTLMEYLAMEHQKLKKIDTIRVAYIWVGQDANYWNSKYQQEYRKIGHINILFENVDGASALPHTGKEKYFLILTFAYDSNAAGGNEFWVGAYSASMDPATACCSQVAEIFNSYVNPFLNINRFYVAKKDGSVAPYKEYKGENQPRSSSTTQETPARTKPSRSKSLD